jgi:hypothetical protein
MDTVNRKTNQNKKEEDVKIHARDGFILAPNEEDNNNWKNGVSPVIGELLTLLFTLPLLEECKKKKKVGESRYGGRLAARTFRLIPIQIPYFFL